MANNKFTIGAVGDISLETSSGSPLENISGLLSNSDILFGNLECSVSDTESSARKAVPISVPISRLKHIDAANFDVLNLANNHTLDSGIDSLCHSVNWLHSAGIDTVGLNQQHPNGGLTIREYGDTRVGVIGYTESSGQFTIDDILSKDIFFNIDFFTGRRNTYYTPSKTEKRGLTQYTLSKVVNDIRVAKQYCDILIVSIHWGTENVFYPSPRQINEARTIIDCGANIVLGHHPHVPQGVEEYNGGIIAYSLGNFQFDLEKSKSPTNYSFIIEIRIDSGTLSGFEIHPIEIDQNGHPHPMQGDQAMIIRQDIEDLSEPIGNNQVTWNTWFELVGKKYITDNMSSYIRRIEKYGKNALLEAILWSGSPFTVRCALGGIRRHFIHSSINDIGSHL